MFKYVTVIAVFLSLMAMPAVAQHNLANDFVVPTPYPGATNGPVDGDLWQYGQVTYPQTYQNFVLNSTVTSVTGSADIIGWGGWMAGQTMQNQVGDYWPWNDDIFTTLGEMYLIPTSGVQLTDPPTDNMIAQMFTAPAAGLYRVYGRFYGLATSTPGNEGPVKIIKGEYDHSANQTNYLHEVLHTGYIEGSVAGGNYGELGPVPESFFDVFVQLDAGMPVIFMEGMVDGWDKNRFGIDASIDLVPEPGSLLALGSGLLGLVGFAIRRKK